MTPWTAAHQASFPVLYYPPEFAQTHAHSVSDAIQPFHLLPPAPPALHLSQHQSLFQWIVSLQQVAKVLEFQHQHQSFPRIFRVDFLKDWLVWSASSPRSLKSLLRHHSSKASVLWLSAFFMVQLSYPYVTTGKTIALTRQISVGKVMSLPFNMLSLS